MKKFIYVYNVEAKDKMVAAGYKLLRESYEDSCYVFLNQPDFKFSKIGTSVSYILSDTLKF